MRITTFLLPVVILSSLVICDCTGTRVKVDPDPASLRSSFPTIYKAAAVKEVSADKIYPLAGTLVQGFADEVVGGRGLAASSLFGFARYWTARHRDAGDDRGMTASGTRSLSGGDSEVVNKLIFSRQGRHEVGI